MWVLKVKVISLPYIFQVVYALCFTRPRYQVSVYRTNGPLVNFSFQKNKQSVFTFLFRKAWFTKFDIAIKQVKVNPWSYFEQTIIGQIPKCYIPAILEICPLLPVKKNFKEFLPNMPLAAILFILLASY